MANRLPAVTCVREAIKAYGSKRTMAKAFGVRQQDIDRWCGPAGVPAGHCLGLYFGLQARGRKAGPELYGLVKWADLPGWGKP